MYPAHGKARVQQKNGIIFLVPAACALMGQDCMIYNIPAADDLHMKLHKKFFLLEACLRFSLAVCQMQYSRTEDLLHICYDSIIARCKKIINMNYFCFFMDSFTLFLSLSIPITLTSTISPTETTDIGSFT